ncbi:MAG: hypothetical protein KAW47_08750 [Thermoplasmatales archaeon]|nr:hypothetical protein [Thermoplasmatales archaeon]
MPVDIIDLGRLILAIILLIIPGYLWSFIFSKDLKRLERIVFGFVLSLCVLSFGSFIIDVLLGLPITATKVFLLLAVYTIPVLILYSISVLRFDSPIKKLKKFKKLKLKEFIKLKFKKIKNPKFLLLAFILAFSAFMIFLPHYRGDYFLPFHVDEWMNWSYGKAVMETGSSAFIDPYLGSGIVQSLEPGFDYITASLSWISGSNFVTMYVFMPSIIAIFTSLVAFNVGERSERRFGLEAALLVSLIPTTCRFLGPSFFVSVSLGLLFIAFTIWFLQQKKLLLTPLIPIIIWCTFLIHPPTALAGIIITIIYALMLLLEKKYKLSAITAGLSLVPIGFVFLLATRWDVSLQQVIDAFLGGKYFSEYNLPKILVSFEHMGTVVWVLCIIGAYFAFSKGKTTVRSIGLSAITFIALIGLYDKFGYGIPIMYERSFMYLFLMVALIAGWGLSELRRTITEISERFLPRQYVNLKKYTSIIVPVVVCLLLVTTVVPAHMDIPYYQMIDEEDYETFTWIEENIDSFRDENHSYDRGAVNPFYASPFSAVTGLYTVSSIMCPLYGYNLHGEMEKFLNEKCVDTSFMDQHKISVVYTTSCNNSNLTMIYPNVYLYPGLYD